MKKNFAYPIAAFTLSIASLPTISNAANASSSLESVVSEWQKDAKQVNHRIGFNVKSETRYSSVSGQSGYVNVTPNVVTSWINMLSSLEKQELKVKDRNKDSKKCFAKVEKQSHLYAHFSYSKQELKIMVGEDHGCISFGDPLEHSPLRLWKAAYKQVPTSSSVHTINDLLSTIPFKAYSYDTTPPLLRSRPQLEFVIGKGFLGLGKSIRMQLKSILLPTQNQ